MKWQLRQSRRKAIQIAGHAHALTFSCYKRFPFFKAERTCAWLADAIEQAGKRHCFDLWAYVFMPDHVHLIVYPRQPVYQIASIMFAIKQPVAKRAISWLRKERPDWIEKLTRKRGARTETLFWQSGGGYDRNVENSETLLLMIDYIHLNPVRKHLVESALAWRWSSAASFEGGESPLRIAPIPEDWLT